MSLPALGFDPGPLARLEEITNLPNTMEVIAQRVADGQTVKEIAKAWEVPFGKLMLWIESDDARSKLYWAASAWDAHARIQDGGKLADDAALEEVPKVKMQLGQRQWAVERLFKDRYAPRAEHTGAGGAPLIPEDPQEIARRMLFALRRADEMRVVSEVPPATHSAPPATHGESAAEPI